MSAYPIEDHLAIEQLIKNASIGAMRADSELWASTWADDATWKIDSMEEPAVGKSSVVAIFEKIISTIEFASVYAFSSDLIIDGDTAHGKVYSQELIFRKDSAPRIVVGCFSDQYVKRNERWYFLVRELETLRRGPFINA